MPRMLDDRMYFTADEAALALLTTPLRVLVLMREKRLLGMHVDGEWLIEGRSLRACQAEGVEGVKSPKCVVGCASAAGCGCGGTSPVEAE